MWVEHRLDNGLRTNCAKASCHANLSGNSDFDKYPNTGCAVLRGNSYRDPQYSIGNAAGGCHHLGKNRMFWHLP